MMMSNLIKELLFHQLYNIQLLDVLQTDKASILTVNSVPASYINNLSTTEIIQQLDFPYVTESQFNSSVVTIRDNVELALFHLNVRSLNSPHCSLCRFLQLLDIEFDVLILSEIWTYNIEFYHNILPGFTFYYDLPVDSKAGGIGIFIRSTLSHQELIKIKY
jgi:hypothetical protein